MLTDGRTDGRTHGRTDDGRKVITIAHPEQSSGELKTNRNIHFASFSCTVPVCACLKSPTESEAMPPK